MTQHRIVFIPGKNAKPPADLHREQLWRCLAEGIRRVDPELAGELTDDQFSLIPWNPLFYKNFRDIQQDLPWIERLLKQQSPSEADVAEVRSWKKRFAWMSYVLADKFPILTRLFSPAEIKTTLSEINQYFENQDGVARAIRDSVKSVLLPFLKADDKILLVGHSLGSVIAYDTLWELTHRDQHAGKIDLFLSLGSPLGINTIQKHLLGWREDTQRRYPRNIRRWCNISAHGELVALDRRFSDDFREMLELNLVDHIEDKLDGVFNHYRTEDGLNVHRCYGYFTNPIVGGVIADWLREN